MKKCTRKKRYDKGRRREIVGLILQSGGLTNRGLELYWRNKDEYKNKSQIIATLKKEGIISEQKFKAPGAKQIRIYTLKNFDERNKEYISDFKVGTYATYKNYLFSFKKDIGDSYDVQRQLRASNSINANMLMYLSGIKCDAETMFKLFDKRLISKGKAEGLEEGGNCYFQNLYPKTLKKYRTSSRSVGTLINQDNEAYAVYNIGSTRPKWKQEDEKKHWRVLITNCVNMLKPGENIKTDIENQQAIFIAEEKPIIDLITHERIKNKIFKESFLTLPSMYRAGLYYVPFNTTGIKLLHLMSRKNWKEQIYKEILQNLYNTAHPNSGIAHDAYIDGVRILCFCVPDIERLRNFMINAREADDKTKWIVCCYKEQESLVKTCVGDWCTIKTFNIDDYTNIGEIKYDF